jgi:hypothetical protein
VDLGHQIRAEGFVYGTMARDPGHVGKTWRTEDHAEMAFSTNLISSMTTMLFAFINNFKKFRGKRVAQRLMNSFRPVHFFAVPSSIPVKKH